MMYQWQWNMNVHLNEYCPGSKHQLSSLQSFACVLILIHTLQLNFLFSDWLSSKYAECIENVYCTLRTCAQTARGAFGARTSHRLIHFFHWVKLLIRGRVNNSLQPSLFSSHGCIYTKVAVSTSSMNLCLSCPVTWTVLHAWLHYGISIKTMHFDHCQ